MKTTASFLIAAAVFVFTTSCFSQEKKDEAFDETLKNWVLASVSYVENNDSITPKSINDWILKTFYAYPIEKEIYKSFNGSVYKFLNENFKKELSKEKLYFIQEYTPFGCSNNRNYYILNSSNQLTKISNFFVDKSGWKIKKSTTHDFETFENNFDIYSDYEITELNDNAIYSYYIITEFNKTSVRIKVLVSSI